VQVECIRIMYSIVRLIVVSGTQLLIIVNQKQFIVFDICFNETLVD
jgi:hypothetical protein